MDQVVHIFQEDDLEGIARHFSECFQLRRSSFPERFVGTSVCLCGGVLSVLSLDNGGVYGVYHPRVMV
jgi:hypothetical protein